MDISKLKCKIPEQESGDWKIVKFEVSEEEAEFFNLRQLINNRPGREILPGNYTKLMHKEYGLVMSDTQAEILDQTDIMYEARENVLINGLGLGLVLQYILSKSEVKKVVVNEISSDLINMIQPYFTDPRLTINHANAFTWKPDGIRFNVVWHDIWYFINGDLYPEMKKLKRRYAHWLQEPHWQGCWCEWWAKRDHLNV